MKRFNIAVALLAAGLLSTAGAYAAEAVGPLKGQIYLSPGALFLGEDANEDLNSFVGGQIGYGTQITDRFALEYLYGFADTEVSGGGPGGDDDVDIETARVDALWYLSGDAWRPYLVGGIGAINFENDETGASDGDVQLNFGAGLMRPITDRLRFRGDARGFVTADDGDLVPGATLGLQYVFAGPVTPPDADGDGVSDATDQCPNTPAGVRVDSVGCPIDSDGDGVDDSNDRCPNTPSGVRVDEDGCPVDTDRDGVPDFRDDCPNTPRADAVDSRGCTQMEEVEERVEVTVNFDFDSARLRRDAPGRLDRVASFMERYPEAEAQVAGHTDSIGTEAYNQDLSRRRADAVRDYLVEQGISEDRISTVGYGESRPVASNDTPEGRQENRRATVVSITTGERPVRR